MSGRHVVDSRGLGKTIVLVIDRVVLHGTIRSLHHIVGIREQISATTCFQYCDDVDFGSRETLCERVH